MSVAIFWLKSIGKEKAYASAISRVCEKIGNHKTAYGFTWRFTCK